MKTLALEYVSRVPCSIAPNTARRVSHHIVQHLDYRPHAYSPDSPATMPMADRNETPHKIAKASSIQDTYASFALRFIPLKACSSRRTCHVEPSGGATSITAESGEKNKSPVIERRSMNLGMLRETGVCVELASEIEISVNFDGQYQSSVILLSDMRPIHTKSLSVLHLVCPDIDHRRSSPLLRGLP